MVAVQPAAHGIPTIAFAAGGVMDTVKDGVSAWIVPPGDYEGLTEAILSLLERRDLKKFAKYCMDFAFGFRWGLLGDKPRSICLETTGKDHMQSMP